MKQYMRMTKLLDIWSFTSDIPMTFPRPATLFVPLDIDVLSTKRQPSAPGGQESISLSSVSANPFDNSKLKAPTSEGDHMDSNESLPEPCGNPSECRNVMDRKPSRGEWPLNCRRRRMTVTWKLVMTNSLPPTD